MLSNRKSVQKPKVSMPAGPIMTALLLLTMAGGAAAQVKVIYSFSYAEGESPRAGLTIDAKGNLYGTTAYGGAHGAGAVFELSREGNGDWTEKTIYSFGSFLGDARDPLAGVILDPEGRLYGSTFGGGEHANGAVFQLTPHATGIWTGKVLYSFYASVTDGMSPWGGVVRDAKGNIYGTTYYGGAHEGGTVYKLIPKATGEWTEKILHSFVDTTADGQEPHGNLVLDAKGNLYGVTYAGGKFNLGTVFELTPEAGGWKEDLIHEFGSPATGPWSPEGGVVFDSKGNLFGTTIFGGSPCDTCGTVYELSRGAGGKWSVKTLHSFKNGKIDGHAPEGTVVFDALGNLYGTTFYGGAYLSYGSIFELTPAGGSWTEKLLHSFDSNGKDGIRPIGGLVHDAAGNLYGTASGGGENGEGIVFEIVHPHKAQAP